ncbi:tetratricopeptide repeat protein [Alteromonas sp. M12]|uniref:tetratricopeptide repeat protein n=1 Tax=Alteromonas sp. M12 TaxID=3135644 RepID=UPI00319E316A
MPSDTLNVASTEEILVRLLHNLKASYIREENYQMALRAVDLLIELCPDDPYERRDRGFLLHQLECPQVAINLNLLTRATDKFPLLRTLIFLL